jgi:hypothetical protein
LDFSRFTDYQMLSPAAIKLAPRTRQNADNWPPGTASALIVIVSKNVTVAFDDPGGS